MQATKTHGTNTERDSTRSTRILSDTKLSALLAKEFSRKTLANLAGIILPVLSATAFRRRVPSRKGGDVSQSTIISYIQGSRPRSIAVRKSQCRGRRRTDRRAIWQRKFLQITGGDSQRPEIDNLLIDSCPTPHLRWRVVKCTAVHLGLGLSKKIRE